MCEQHPATKEFAFPVCDECHAWLTDLGGELKAMEDADPNLAKLARNVEQSTARLAAKGGMVSPSVRPTKHYPWGN